MIFKKKDINYPIRSVPDNFPGVAYRTGPNGLMDKNFMKESFRESRVIKKLPCNRLSHLFVENCSTYKSNVDLVSCAETIMTTFRFFFQNATDLIQPCD